MKSKSKIAIALALYSVLIGVTSAVLTARQKARNDLVVFYFAQGFEYKAILCFLHFVHGIILSLRQLKRVLKNCNLRRRKTQESNALIRQLILVSQSIQFCNRQVAVDGFPSGLQTEQGELNTGSGCLLGYRSMWKRLYHKYGLICRRLAQLV